MSGIPPRRNPPRLARGQVYFRRGTEDFVGVPGAPPPVAEVPGEGGGDVEMEDIDLGGLDLPPAEGEPGADEEPDADEGPAVDGEPVDVVAPVAAEPGDLPDAVDEPPPLPPLPDDRHFAVDDHVNFKNNRTYAGTEGFTRNLGSINLFEKYASNGVLGAGFRPHDTKSLKKISTILRLGAKRFMMTRNAINNLAIQAGFSKGATPDVISGILMMFNFEAWRVLHFMKLHKFANPHAQILDSTAHLINITDDEIREMRDEEPSFVNALHLTAEMNQRNIDYSMDDDEDGKKTKARYLEMIQTSYPYLMKALYWNYKSVTTTAKSFAPYIRISNSAVYSTREDLKKLIESKKFKYLGSWENVLRMHIIQNHESAKDAVKDIIYVMANPGENFIWFNLQEPYEFE